ncbi:MAG TPA: hypothetical protein VEZ11_16780 [Thermoanaerobaculia bacterium]|nr:hypothetical protein [Thermoanaerobaculia bacterium]
MKRIFFPAALVLLTILAFGAAALAKGGDSSGSALTIRPSDMKDGETKVLVEGSRKITVHRDGDAMRVEIEGAGKTKKIVISHDGDGLIRIDRDGALGRSMVIGPNRRKIVIDGLPSAKELVIPELRHLRMNQTMYVCPKDHTTLRVPGAATEGKDNPVYKCPVDGTQMEKKQGHGFSFFFDDESFESDDL